MPADRNFIDMHRINFTTLRCSALLLAGNAFSNERLFQDPTEFDAAYPPLMVEVSIP